MSEKVFTEYTLNKSCVKYGSSYIKRIEGSLDSVVRLACGHVQQVKQYSIYKNTHVCKVCHANKLCKLAEESGITFLKVTSPTYAYYRLPCNHVVEIRNDGLKKGKKYRCPNCHLPRGEYMKKYQQDNKEKLSVQNKEWRMINKDVISERNRLHRLANLDSHLERQRKHYRDNKALYLYYSKCRKLKIKQRMPKWLTKDEKKEILTYYRESNRLTETTGIAHHVDHIVPLEGETVCGLHVPWNLQILTAVENLTKSNKLLQEYMEI